jgi:DNA alkylation repair enzyme
MSEAGDFIDATLQRESSWRRVEAELARFDPELEIYGASVGAVRGTVRDALRRYKDLGRDGITALSSELWAVPVYERRLAAVVVLQSSLGLLDNSDLTRIEGFLRGAHIPELGDPLAVDVVGPLIARLDGPGRSRAGVVLGRWLQDADPWLRRAALLTPLRELKAGTGDWDAFRRRAASAVGDPDGVVRAAVHRVEQEVGKARPDLIAG